jgi:uncharacterized membrane protein
MDLRTLLESEEIHLKKLHELVENSLKEEALLTSKLIEQESDDHLTLSERVSDVMASLGGSWKFITGFLGFLVIWIVGNVAFLKSEAFDPYPFILLNLILSCVAALQAPVIMMSQNRKEEKDRRRARSDYLINLKAEMEVRNLHSKMDLLMSEQMQALFKIQQAQIELLEKIMKQVAPAHRSEN